VNIEGIAALGYDAWCAALKESLGVREPRWEELPEWRRKAWIVAAEVIVNGVTAAALT
jgi:hypothetical protein